MKNKWFWYGSSHSYDLTNHFLSILINFLLSIVFIAKVVTVCFSNKLLFTNSCSNYIFISMTSLNFTM